MQPLHLFNHSKQQHFLGSPDGDAGEYEHSLGGGPSDFNLRFSGPAAQMHLIYRLDLADPRIDFKIPNVRWLPLCYGFGFNGNRTTCLAHSDSHVETIGPVDVEFNPNFPYANFPPRFAKHHVALTQAAYDPSDVDDALRLSAVFGFKGLSPAGRETAIKRLDEFDFFEEIDAYEMTKDEFLETCGSPFVQGAPETDCPNPSCAAFRQSGALTVIGLLEGDPTDDISLWGGHEVQLIFQRCRFCNCISVTNQCT